MDGVFRREVSCDQEWVTLSARSARIDCEIDGASVRSIDEDVKKHESLHGLDAMQATFQSPRVRMSAR
jgi:hypothetical protein